MTKNNYSQSFKVYHPEATEVLFSAPLLLFWFFTVKRNNRDFNNCMGLQKISKHKMKYHQVFCIKCQQLINFGVY